MYYFTGMINARDLHFDNEILPLFDHTLNEYARETLFDLLSRPVASPGEINYRQDILKGFLSGPLPDKNYAKIEFYQAYKYIEERKTRSMSLRGNALKVHLLFARKEQGREKGGLNQLFLFLARVNELYFSRLDLTRFPLEFSDGIRNIQRMMNDLQVERNRDIARQRQFNLLELTSLLDLLADKVGNGEMDAFWKGFFLFEAWCSVAIGIKKQGFVFPEFPAAPSPASESLSAPSPSATPSPASLSITGFYHPLLKNPVKNNITIRNSVTLITGPNMSGKSTLLKSIGLCVYLAHLGLAVPAAKCELPFFDAISIAINLNDDIRSGYSHFMAEVQTLKKVVLEARSGKKCFAIFDELFRGTNVEDALAVSAKTITGLSAFSDSCFFISTHLHELQQTLDFRKYPIDARFIDCTIDNGLPRFTYLLRDGWSDLRIGQIIFEQEGLNTLLSA
jgi:DNA mismatch repair protein MutS